MSKSKEWESIIFNLAYSDKDNWIFPPLSKHNSSPSGMKSPLDKFVEKLRSGEDMPASAAEFVADLIEGKYHNRLELAPVQKNIRTSERGASSITYGLEIRKIIRDKGKSVSSAITEIAEYSNVDERTIWRYWTELKSKYPENYLEEIEEINREFDKEIEEFRAIKRIGRNTDKK